MKLKKIIIKKGYEKRPKPHKLVTLVMSVRPFSQKKNPKKIIKQNYKSIKYQNMKLKKSQ